MNYRMLPMSWDSSEVDQIMREMQSALQEAERARLKELNNQLEIAVVGLEMGRMPPPEEIARRGKRVVYPNGRIEWYWDSTCILVERDRIGDFVPYVPNRKATYVSATADKLASPGGPE